MHLPSFNRQYFLATFLIINRIAWDALMCTFFTIITWSLISFQLSVFEYYPPPPDWLIFLIILLSAGLGYWHFLPFWWRVVSVFSLDKTSIKTNDKTKVPIWKKRKILHYDGNDRISTYTYQGTYLNSPSGPSCCAEGQHFWAIETDFMEEWTTPCIQRPWVIWGQCCTRVAAALSLPNGRFTQLSPYFTQKPGNWRSSTSIIMPFYGHFYHATLTLLAIWGRCVRDTSLLV